MTTIERREAGDVRILDIHGRVALGDGDRELSLAVKECLDQDHAKIVLNLANVPWMDSSGLGTTVACKLRAMRQEGDVKLFMPGASKIPLPVQTCLRLEFRVFDDEPSAVASFRG